MFENCESIIDVVTESRKLKAEGKFSVEEINMAASAKRKELAKTSKLDYQPLKRENIDIGCLYGSRIALLPLVIEDLKSNKIVMAQDGKVIL